MSYTTFAWSDLRVAGQPLAGVVECRTDGGVTVEITVRNTGALAGTEVVQVYLHDPVAQVNRPVVRLVGYVRVPLVPGEARRVAFDLHADLSSFAGRHGHRVVEPGDLELRLSTSSSAVRCVVPMRLVGPERAVGFDRRMTAEATVW